jgi:ferredoxin
MTYTITKDCIACQRCLSSCPTGAIQTNGLRFWIDIHRCNQCQGSHGVPQCWAVCPTNEGCVPLSTGMQAAALTSASKTATDYWKIWFARYAHLMSRLKASQQTGYWQHWFDAYSQALQTLQIRSDNSTNIPLRP